MSYLCCVYPHVTVFICLLSFPAVLWSTVMDVQFAHSFGWYHWPCWEKIILCYFGCHHIITNLINCILYSNHHCPSNSAVQEKIRGKPADNCACSFLAYSVMNPDSLILCSAGLAWGSLLWVWASGRIKAVCYWYSGCVFYSYPHKS